jgi:prepilin-type N-terminal cleavage/methylation domain-containing protein
MFMKKDSRGFSLIELLIVVAIILIIAAIAIPNLLRSRIAANQASAVGSIRTINTADVTYSTTYNKGYSPTLAALGPAAGGGNPTATNADLIDSVLASGTKSGYTFTYTAGAADANGNINTYGVKADPTTPGTSGQNHYGSDQSGVIRYNTTAAVSITDGSTPDTTDNPLQ